MKRNQNSAFGTLFETSGEPQPVAEMAETGSRNTVLGGWHFQACAFADPVHAVGRYFDPGCRGASDRRPQRAHEDDRFPRPAGFIRLARRLGQLINNAPFQPFRVFLAVVALYFVVCYPLSQLSRLLERRLHAGSAY